MSKRRSIHKAPSYAKRLAKRADERRKVEFEAGMKGLQAITDEQTAADLKAGKNE